MKLAEKQEEVKVLSETFKKAELTILADYRGMNVGQVTNLRRALREVKATMKVVKNTLAQRAVEGTEMDSLKDHFKGTIAIIHTEGDPVGPAKALTKFGKDVEALKLKVGFLSGKVINEKEIESLSKLPSREEMIAKLMGSMQAPAQNLVNVLSALPRNLAYALAAVRDKKQQ